MDEDLRRAFALLAAGDMGGARTEPARFGLAVFDERVPLRYDSNYLLVDDLPEAVSADDLAEEAGRLDRPAVMIRDRRTGERLAPGFEALGWTVHRGLVMAHRRPPTDRPRQTRTRTDSVSQLQEIGSRRLSNGGHWAADVIQLSGTGATTRTG